MVREPPIIAVFESQNVEGKSSLVTRRGDYHTPFEAEKSIELSF